MFGSVRLEKATEFRLFQLLKLQAEFEFKSNSIRNRVNNRTGEKNVLFFVKISTLSSET